MSVLVQYFSKKVITSSLRLNKYFIIPRLRLGQASSSSIIMATSSHQTNPTSIKNDDEKINSNKENSFAEEKCDYESAVLKLHSLVSNAETLARARENLEYRHMSHIANINKFILRSGLKDEDIDKMSIIHVSGTKGKGSTCAFCERILHNKGYKTGLFTSPHLVEVRERIRINGQPVSKEVYAHHFWKVYNRLKATHEDKNERLPAYFAFNMILSLHIFLSEGVDVSIIEVGIGGQYDSTNFIRKPVVCGVTSLGYDHVSILGNSIEEIAWNKAGIFKMGCPAIVVNQPYSAMKVILDRAKERQSALYLAKPIDKEVLARENVNLGISGSKQADNAGLAVQLARVWEERRDKVCLEPVVCNVSDVTRLEEIPVLETTCFDRNTAKGLTSCVWPGRAQTVKRSQVTYYLDGAHTKESIEVCSQWFQEKADEEMKSLKVKVARVLIFNVTGERKPGPLLECLKECRFDAAGFCTNSVSSAKSYNNKDQFNPKYTSEMMIEKAEENRLCWESLNQNSMSSGDVLSSIINHTISSADGGISKPIVYKSSSSTQNCPNLVSVPVMASSISINSTTTASTNKSNADFSSPEFVSSPLKDFSNGDCCHHKAKQEMENSNKDYTSNNNTDIKNYNTDNIISNNDDVVISKGDSVMKNDSYVIENSNSNDVISDRGDGNHIKEKINEINSSTSFSSSSSSSSSSSAHSFPCVLEALMWATQRKDPSLMDMDPMRTLSPPPLALVDADHVQVLVTGSLLLVGGVLGVITPDMND